MASMKINLCICAFLSGFLLQVLSAEVAGSTVPAFVISDTRWSGAGVIDYTSLTWDDLAVKLLGSDDDSKVQERPSAIVAVLTNENGEGLQHTWEGSASSLMLPHMLLDGAHDVSASSLSASFAKAGRQGRILSVGPCSLPEGTAEEVGSGEDLKGYVESRSSSRQPGTTDLIFICSAEEAMMSNAVKVVQEAIPGHIILFTQTVSSMGGGEARSRRLVAASLGGKNGNATATCDGLCSTKVMILETIFVAVTLLIVLVSGLYCISAIDTPTKFEVPRDT